MELKQDTLFTLERVDQLGYGLSRVGLSLGQAGTVLRAHLVMPTLPFANAHQKISRDALHS